MKYIKTKNLLSVYWNKTRYYLSTLILVILNSSFPNCLLYHAHFSWHFCFVQAICSSYFELVNLRQTVVSLLLSAALHCKMRNYRKANLLYPEIFLKRRDPSLLTGNCFLNGLRWAKTQDIVKPFRWWNTSAGTQRQQARGPLMILIKLVEMWKMVNFLNT